MNENYAHPAHAGGRGARASCAGMYLFQRAAARAKAPRVQLLGLGRDPERGDRGRRPARRATGASPPTSGAARASPSCAATGWRSRAGTCSTRRASREDLATSSSCLAETAGPGGRRDRLRARLRRADPAVRAAPLRRARHRRLRPLATRARSCAASSRSTATTSTVAALKALADEGTLPEAKVAEAIQQVRHRSRQAGPLDRLSARRTNTP